MANRITPQQIETARTAFRNGKSIPECCTIANMSRASFNKYLGREVTVWVDEHTAKAQPKAIANDEPPMAVNLETIKDDQPQETPISQLSYDEFISYVEFELTNAPDDFVYIKDLYWQLKKDARQDYRKTVKLRELYESRLNQLTKVEPEEQYQESADNKTIIRQYRDSLKIKLPIAKDANEWNDFRLYEHIIFWVEVSRNNRKSAHQLLSELDTLEKRQKWINCNR